jgi:hypothetical protein
VSAHGSWAARVYAAANSEGTPYVPQSEVAALLSDGNGGTRGTLLSNLDPIVLRYFEKAFKHHETKLGGVSQTPNLRHTSFNGIPTIPGGETMQTRDKLDSFLEKALEKMGYMRPDQTLTIYSSFLRTTTHQLQNPHIDYKWEDVLQDQPITPRNRKETGAFNENVPLIAVFPITKAGMVIQVWPDATSFQTGPIPGKLVHISYGQILVLRGDVVHAGGFMLEGAGDPRVHLYLHRDPGTKPNYPLSNQYKNRDGEPLTESHVHGEEASNFEKEPDKCLRLVGKWLPPTDTVKWKYDRESRVIRLDFSETAVLERHHKVVLAQLYELSSITVVSKGLHGNFPGIHKFVVQGLEGHGEEPYHKFRLYHKVEGSDSIVTPQEQDKLHSMRMSDYLLYLDKHYGVDKEPKFVYQATFEEGKAIHYETIEDATKVVFYMIDAETASELPALDKIYKQNFKAPEMLPGGDWCVMDPVSASSNPGSLVCQCQL